MVHVEDLGFTLRELNLAILSGDVRKQVHPEFPELAIYNYGEEVQFRNRWNNITLACRGLILNQDTGEVVARPWEKFFNFGQMDNRIESSAPVEVTDKLDGSLGILYNAPDGWAIATRGSFASEQAIHATKLLRSKYINDDKDSYSLVWLELNTFLFEIIYPANRIVCNYGDMDDLVMLGSVNKERGDYHGPIESAAYIQWEGPVTEVWKYPKFTDALSAPDREGKEGYVIRSGRNIVKLKQADYVALHRIVTNLSPKTVWEMLGEGRTVDDICKDIPDEFYTYVEDIAHDLRQQSSAIRFSVDIAFDKILYDLKVTKGDDWTRKDFARMATRAGNQAKYLFLKLDKKDITRAIWLDIKPKGEKPIVEDKG
jgi:RNA ligase